MANLRRDQIIAQSAVGRYSPPTCSLPSRTHPQLQTPDGDATRQIGSGRVSVGWRSR
jgi:hypothetical protein